jgi:hypothetical protein
VPPAFGRIQAELLAEPDRGLIEIGTAYDDVVEPEHRGHPNPTVASHSARDPQAGAAGRPPDRRARPSTARAQEGFERESEGFGFAVNLAFAQDGTMFVADKDVARSGSSATARSSTSRSSRCPSR